MIKDLLKQQGIFSICSANEFVICAAIENAAEQDSIVLIEATANQVNQYGGYTGMRPVDFRNFVHGIADRYGFPHDRIILGGDHLGPLTWKNENSQQAMEKAAILVREFVMAGFSKIHIDTSMPLADDFPGNGHNTDIIASRGAYLCSVAESAFVDYKKVNPKAMEIVYVVGSEVPVPGGSQDDDEKLTVTDADEFMRTVDAFRHAFENQGIGSAWHKVIAFVVQPGVEFGDRSIHEYDRKAAESLCSALKEYDGLVFEGHSTDYQTPVSLREMVEDGIAVLKVGPALTFYLREALFALCLIERELLCGAENVMLSDFINVLDDAMVRNPGDWIRHYHGTPAEQAFSRKYSFSDRCRYYLPDDSVKASIQKLVSNLTENTIPLTLLSQYMPLQYAAVRRGDIGNNPEELIKDRIKDCIRDYNFAKGSNKS